jgi:16S rRNA (cytosine1402-N4)-methyltransferase
MNPSRGLSAAQWLERASLETLEGALRENADGPYVGEIADELDARRGHLATTKQLAEAVRHALVDVRDTNEVDRSVRRVFQALRIEVNDEFGVLEALLRDLPYGLKPGGHVAILSFHSGEDRRVKKAFQAGERSGVYAAVAPDVIRAGMTERFDNPRSRPAKLRWARRAG